MTPTVLVMQKQHSMLNSELSALYLLATAIVFE